MTDRDKRSTNVVRVIVKLDRTRSMCTFHTCAQLMRSSFSCATSLMILKCSWCLTSFTLRSHWESKKCRRILSNCIAIWSTTRWSESIWNTFGLPACRFMGTLLLSLCLFLRPILKIWSIGIALMSFTWANHSERWTLVSNVSMTYNGLCKFCTSDLFSYVWALP